MNDPPRKKPYPLQERTIVFARDVRLFSSQLLRIGALRSDVWQLIRSSGSVGANYIEADEALSKRDAIVRLKIARKEAKESHYWLLLLNRHLSVDLESMRLDLLSESRQLILILTAMIKKAEHLKP